MSICSLSPLPLLSYSHGIFSYSTKAWWKKIKVILLIGFSFFLGNGPKLHQLVILLLNMICNVTHTPSLQLLNSDGYLLCSFVLSSNNWLQGTLNMNLQLKQSLVRSIMLTFKARWHATNDTLSEILVYSRSILTFCLRSFFFFNFKKLCILSHLLG